MKYLILLITLLLLFTASAYIATAQTATVSVYVPCTNYNWQISPQCTAPVADFWPTPTGFSGVLESGVTFTQTRLTQKMMLFEMEAVRWLTYQDKIVYLD